jgi:aminopeptidase N
MHMPLALGLLDREGRELPVVLPGEALPNMGGTRVLDLRSARDTFSLQNLGEEPYVSLLRGFSAPVKLQIERTDEELAFLMANDTDPFARWEAGQELAVKLILGLVADRKAGRPLHVPPSFVTAFGRALVEDAADKAFAAEMLTLPSEDYLGELMPEIDVDGIFAAREMVRRVLAQELGVRFQEAYVENDDSGPYRYTAEAVGRRALKNLALLYLVLSGEATAAELCLTQLAGATNMTDELGALNCLAYVDRERREAALARFFEKWQHDPLVLDKWFAAQASFRLPETLERVQALLAHPAFDPKNPNKLYALVGAFSNNHVCFHDLSGAGYAFLADQVLALDSTNGIVAARLLGPLGRWRRYDVQRQGLMRAQLERIARKPGLSPNVFEIASKSLG